VEGVSERRSVSVDDALTDADTVALLLTDAVALTDAVGVRVALAVLVVEGGSATP